MKDPASLPYRPCAGIMLVNRQGKVFVGQRLDTSSEAWQMPQGGIDKGEDAEVAAMRELEEETGIAADKVALIARSAEELVYDLPDEMIGKMWKGKYRGQRQTWFLMRFLGEDEDINIKTKHQEFRAWSWVDSDQIVDLIVPFKKKLYRDILAEFGEMI